MITSQKSTHFLFYGSVASPVQRTAAEEGKRLGRETAKSTDMRVTHLDEHPITDNRLTATTSSSPVSILFLLGIMQSLERFVCRSPEIY